MSQKPEKKKDSTEDLRISFDSSLSLDQKNENVKVEKVKRFSPYTKKKRR